MGRDSMIFLVTRTLDLCGSTEFIEISNVTKLRLHVNRPFNSNKISKVKAGKVKFFKKSSCPKFWISFPEKILRAYEPIQMDRP